MRILPASMKNQNFSTLFKALEKCVPSGGFSGGPMGLRPRVANFHYWAENLAKI